jgi:hypothetical protein
MIPCTLKNPRDFTERLLVLAINIATAYREDIETNGATRGKKPQELAYPKSFLA